MCFGGRDDGEAKRSREIDALIHRDEKVMQKVVKLLLLGKPPFSIDDEQANQLLIMMRNRCWREWEVDNIEADASDIHKGWLHKKREGGMAGYHLQQHPRWPTNDN